MVRLTLIARISDGLPLAEGLDSEKDSEIDQYKAQAKSLFKKFGQQPHHQTPRMSVESGKYMFHYILDSGVAFLTLTEKGYPKKLAFQYLEELCGEFGRLYGSQVDGVQRPYAFIKFDTFIQKTKKLYMDTRTQRNLTKLSEDLSEVHSIMTRNIQEVLGQGEKLDNMTKMSSTLAAESKQYSTRAKSLHHQALLKKYVPLFSVILIVLVLMWIKSKLYR
ncbi:R-SNARE protein, Sec22-family [Haematococcus lacustris]|nr:hypothetical protein QJQ45_029141 [Haematococcus lacustris]